MYCYQIRFNKVAQKESIIPGALLLDFHNEVIRNAIANDPVAVDKDYMFSRFGVANNQFEIDYFKLHRHIWAHFLQHNGEWCIIIEEDVQLTMSLENIATQVAELPSEWDVFIPFDKQSQPPEQRIEIFSSLLGYFWGAHIYLLSKKGAQKLLSIDTIRQPLDDEILELSHKEVLEGYFMEMGFFTYNEKRSPSLMERRKALTAMMLDFPAWSEPNKKRIKQLIRVLSDIASKANIQLVLHGGTLLGHVRHTGIMPWDDDVDLGICHKELDRFIQAVHQDGRVKFACLVHKKEISTTNYYKFWLEDGEPIRGHSYTFPFVDIWSYYENERFVSYAEGYSYSKDIYFPLRATTFEESSLYVPNKQIEALDAFYDDWRNYVVIYPWSHRQEKAVYKPWKVPIQVDQQGRAIFD